MTIARNYNLSAVERPLALRARSDLVQASVAFSGQPGYVLKDPITLDLFHLTAEEHFLLESLGRSTSLGCLRRDFEQRFAPRRVSYEALQQGLNQLYRQGLLLSDASAQGEELFRRGASRRHSERFQSLMRLLSLRVGSVDATRVVDGLHARLRWLFSLPMLAVALAVVLYAAWILLGQGPEVVAKLPSLAELAQPRYWLLWLATIAAVKVIHELAHAIACHHFGGRCHEIGLMLLAFIPCLYCDVTDVWRLPSKWQRIAVSAAGMAAELFIAAASLIVWWHTQPGLLNTWCLSLMIVCSVGTLLVNANPLLRYDGYYILSDLVEVPNLASRAQGLLPSLLRRWLLGELRFEDPLLSRRQRRGLLVYGVVSRVYIMVVLLGIFAVLLAWARPHRLENLVYTLGVLVVVSMLGRPFSSLWRMMRNPSFRSRLHVLRAAGLALGMVAAVGALMFWPVTRSISGPVVFVPAEGQTVYATTAGELRYAVAPGAQVRQGDVIARLAQPKIELALAEQEGEYHVRRVRYDQLSAMRAFDAKASQLLPTAQAALADAKSQWDELRSKANELVVRAQIAGRIVAPPDIDGVADGCLPSWSGSPLEPRNLGCWVEPGTVLCTVANPSRLEALLAVDQADVPELQAGQQVRILLEATPVRVLEGEVVQIGRRALQPKASRLQPPAKYHLIQVRLKHQDPLLLVGSRGTAKIKASRSTVGKLLASELRQMLRIPW